MPAHQQPYKFSHIFSTIIVIPVMAQGIRKNRMAQMKALVMRLLNNSSGDFTQNQRGAQLYRLFAHFRKCLPQWETMIQESFLAKELQQAYIESLQKRFERI